MSELRGGEVFVANISVLSFVCRRVRADDRLLRPQQTYGLLHHPDLHPLHPDRGPLLGLLLDQERRYASEDGPRYASRSFLNPAGVDGHVTAFAVLKAVKL